MVYCNLIEHNESTVTYAYGENISDITGEIVYDFKNNEINIITRPKKHPVLIRQAQSLFGGHRKEFLNGVFKEKIAYEA
ncbi:hypothetical protein [Clostridium vitabionis]|uniref:hypothetical protein n=1 Tax=Clostridium vitabionis TaxID=2784388 RepID=UPI00188BE0B1|nr:hypothetical protein [Clostridium vitabionis]